MLEAKTIKFVAAWQAPFGAENPVIVNLALKIISAETTPHSAASVPSPQSRNLSHQSAHPVLKGHPGKIMCVQNVLKITWVTEQHAVFAPGTPSLLMIKPFVNFQLSK